MKDSALEFDRALLPVRTPREVKNINLRAAYQFLPFYTSNTIKLFYLFIFEIHNAGNDANGKQNPKNQNTKNQQNQNKTL